MQGIDLFTRGQGKVNISEPENSTKEVTPKDIFRLAQDSPVVDICISYWQAGFMSWEQALIKMVYTLVEENQRLTSEVAEKNRTRQIVLIDHDTKTRFYSP